MPAAWCAGYVAIMLIVGMTLTAAIIGREQRSIFEFAGLTITLGVGGTSASLLLISLMGVRPDRVVLIGVSAVAIVAMTAMWKWDRMRLPVLPDRAGGIRANLLLVSPILILLGGVTIVAIMAVAFPIFDWDATVIWGLKAKVLYFSALSPRPWYFTEVRYNFSHLDYPLLMPMSLAGAYGMMRQVSEPPARVVFPLLFCGQLLIVYTGIRLMIPRLPAMFVTAIVFCAPFAVQQAGMGTADMHLATFHAGAVVYLLRWSMRHCRADAILASLFALLAVLTKAEGLPLAGITALIFIAAAFPVIRRRDIATDLGIFLAILIVGTGVWLAWRGGLPHTDENYASRVQLSTLIKNTSRGGSIVAQFARHTASIRDFGGLWMLIPIFTLLGHRAFALRTTRLLWALLLLQLTLYLVAYIVTPWDVQELMNVSMNRLLTHIAPTAGMVIAAHWAIVRTPDRWGGHSCLPSN